VVPLRASVDRVEIAIRDKEDEFAVGTEDRIGRIVPAIGDVVRLFRPQRVETDLVHALRFRLGVDNPSAVRRPCVVAELPRVGLVHLGDLSAPNLDIGKPQSLIGPEDFLAVGRPGQAILVRVGVLRDLPGRPAAVLGDQPDFILAGGVGDAGDPFAVGRPDGVALVYARRAGQIAGLAVLGRHGEDVASRAEESPFAVASDVIIRDIARDLHQPSPPAGQVLADRDIHLSACFRVEIETIDVPAVLEDDRPVAHRRKLDVEIDELRQLPRFLRAQVAHVEVHPPILVPVGEKVNPLALPHGEDVLSRTIRKILRGLGFEVVNPDVVGHSAAIALPRAKLAKNTVVGQLLAIGRKRAEPASGQRQLFKRPSGRRDRVQPAEKIVERPHARPEDDPLPIRRPGHHDVVRPHAVGYIVASQRGREAQTLRHTPLGGHQIDLRIAVVLTGEGNRFAVRREPGEHLEPFVAREPPRCAALGADGV